MDNDVTSTFNTLQDWENHLCSQVQQVELLGETSLTAQQTQQLGRQWGRFVDHHRSWGRTRICQHIGQKYPCAFAVFLVAQGLHDEVAENGYWPDVDEAIDQELGANWHNQLGRLFEEILEDQHLPLFPDMGGYRYVSLILVHGGIPNYSLFDYFKYMLRPAMTRPIYAAFSSTELIDEWLHHASGRYFSDKPVLRFLEHGGQVAVDFVERTRDLAHEFLEHRLVPPAETVGLPQRVIRAFHQWAVEEHGFDPKDISQRQRTGLRLYRPEIEYDAWGEGFVVQLLPQQIPATLSQARIQWEIRLDGQLETILPVRLERVGYKLQTTAELLVLERAITHCEISLQMDGETRRSWNYSLEGPLLIFDPDRGILLPRGASLPQRPLWLVYPGEATLTIHGDARMLEPFNRLLWGWSKFKGEAWDLSQATQLTLHHNGKQLFAAPIRPDETKLRPHLVGGTLHPTFNLLNTPLYLGAPPTVRIPLVGRTPLDEELSRWRFTLYNPWAAAPDHDMRRVPLTELRPHLIEQDGHVDLPLNSPNLLGETPIGNYVVRLRGPLGRDAELPLRIIPHLYLTGHEQIHLPNPQSGPVEIELLLETPEGIILEAEVEDHPCRVQVLDQHAGCCNHRVLVPPEIIEARLAVVKTQAGSESIRVPLHVPLRRLRWALTADLEDTDSQRLQWAGRPVKQSLDAVEQTTAPVLFVDVGHTDATQPALQEMMTLYLVDLDGTELQRRIFTKNQRDPGRSVWRFELAAFLDTIRQTPSPAVHFELEYSTDEGPVRLPVLSLTRSIQVENVQAEIHDTSLSTSVRITWQEPVRLRHRRVRFWPVWQPWRPYREEIIPDEADGELALDVIGPDFLTGKYLLEFLVVDPWAVPELSSTRPSDNGPNLAVLELTPPAERAAQIEQGISTAPNFSLYLEHAYLEADRDQLDQAVTDLWQCYKWIGEATVSQILAMTVLIEDIDDQKMLTFVRMKMGEPERLQYLLDNFQAGQVSQTQLNDYRDQLLRRTGLWSINTCTALLDFPYEPVQNYALMQLIRRGVTIGGETILARIHNHRLSELDGVDLFELNLDFAADFLAERLNDPITTRLFRGLTERIPDHDWPVLLIYPGYQVYCRAGWGRIDRIEGLESGQTVDHFLRGETGFCLYSTLRPNHDCVPIIIEVLPDRHRVHFSEKGQLYSCTRTKECNFVTPNQDLLYNGHNATAHDGIHAQYQLKTSPLLSVKSPEYRLRAPVDMLR